MQKTKHNNSIPIFLLGFCLLALMTSRLWSDEDNIGERKSQIMEWSGYIQAQFTHSTKAPDSFRIRRARLKLKGEITDSILYKLQLNSGGTPILLDAQIDIKFSPYAVLRFGQYKVPFSLENLTSSSSLDFINRSLAVENLCPGRDIRASGRDIGACIYGEAANIEYSLGLFNGSGRNRLDDNEHKDFSGRLVYSPFNSLSVGFSYYRGKYNGTKGQSSIKRNRKGLEFEFIKERFSLRSEYIFSQDRKLERQGLYVQGVYSIKPKIIGLLIRYDYLDKDRHQKGIYYQIIHLGLNWHISEKAKFQVNFEFHNQEPFPGKDVVLLALLQVGF
jgi:phosphate-selective porin